MERYSQRHLPPLPEEASGCQDRLQPFSRSGTDQDAATVKNTPFFADPGMKLVGELAAFHLYCLYRTCPQTLVTVLAFCVNRGNYTHVTTFLVADLLVSPLSACRYRRNPTTHRPPVSSLPALESNWNDLLLKESGHILRSYCRENLLVNSNRNTFCAQLLAKRAFEFHLPRSVFFDYCFECLNYVRSAS